MPIAVERKLLQIYIHKYFLIPHEVHVKRIHHYHADGNALGGIIKLPESKFVPSQAEVSLSPSGGITSDKTGPFNFDDIVSCSGTETHASGSEHPQTGSWTTEVTTIVTHLNIRNAVTADRVVAKISVEHPREGYAPKVKLVGSEFVNLCIQGKPVTAVLNHKIMTLAADYPPTPWTQNEEFHKTIRDQRRTVSEPPGWAAHLFTDIDPVDSFDQKGYYRCSLVDRIEGKIAGESCGHLVKVPDVGTFIFGQFAVDHSSFRLVMVRAELGSPVTGSVAAGVGHTNGSTEP